MIKRDIFRQKQEAMHQNVDNQGCKVLTFKQVPRHLKGE